MTTSIPTTVQQVNALLNGTITADNRLLNLVYFYGRLFESELTAQEKEVVTSLSNLYQKGGFSRSSYFSNIEPLYTSIKRLLHSKGKLAPLTAITRIDERELNFSDLTTLVLPDDEFGDPREVTIQVSGSGPWMISDFDFSNSLCGDPQRLSDESFSFLCGSGCQLLRWANPVASDRHFSARVVPYHVNESPKRTDLGYGRYGVAVMVPSTLFGAVSRLPDPVGYCFRDLYSWEVIR